MKKHTFLLILIFLSVILSCENNSVEVIIGESITITFEAGYFVNDGWVIIHTANGKAITAKRARGAESFLLENITTDSIALTIVDIKDRENSFIEISTYLNLPRDDYYFYSNTGSYRGTSTIKMFYPAGNYENVHYSYPGGSNDKYPATDTLTYFVNSIYAKAEYNNYSFFGAVYDHETESGYCGWLLNAPYTNYASNLYSLRLERPLQKKELAVDRPMDYLEINAWYGEQRQNFLLYGDYKSDFSIFNVLLPLDFPALQYQVKSYKWDDNVSIEYSQVDSKIPASISIPDLSANYNYNRQEQSYNITRTNGNYDIKEFRWIGEGPSKKVYWRVFGNRKTETIALPELPWYIYDVVTADLNPGGLEAKGMSLHDFYKINSYADYIDLMFKSDINREDERYLHKMTYSKLME